MAEMDERFQQILSWQQMDQNKAISQILQEVSPCPGREGRGSRRAQGARGRTWKVCMEPCPQLRRPKRLSMFRTGRPSGEEGASRVVFWPLRSRQASLVRTSGQDVVITPWRRSPQESV